MAVLGIRRDAFQGLSDRDKTIVKFMGDIVQLGEPARYETPTGVEWFLFADGRFRPIPIAYLGCLIANLNDIPAGYELPIGEEVRVRVPVLDGNGNQVTVPVEVPVYDEETGEPVVDENGDPVTRIVDVPQWEWEIQIVGDGLSRKRLRADIKQFCENPNRTNPLVLPRDVEFTEGGNLWQELLDAQGAPSAIQMADSVPARWTPIGADDV